MARLLRPVTRMISSSPEATASSTTYWMVGLSTTVSISFGCALVAGRKRVPSPAAGRTALRTLLRLPAEPPACAELGAFETLLVIGSVFAHSERIDTILRCGFESVNVFAFERCPVG